MTDNVNHPPHYTGFSNGSEVIDITENLSFNLGNVVKYVTRAGRKTADPTEDLLKAEFYLNRELDRLLPQLNTGSDEPQRKWDLLDHVPPNTIVEDVDGDYYRRISGTAKFAWAFREEVHGQHYEWQDMTPGMYRDIDDYAPFKEVKQ